MVRRRSIVLFSITATALLPIGCTACNAILAARFLLSNRLIRFMTVFQKCRNCTDGRRRSKRQHPFTSRFQLLCPVTVSKLSQAHTSLVPLFSSTAGSQQIFDNLFSRLSDRFRPFSEIVRVVYCALLQIVIIRFAAAVVDGGQRFTLHSASCMPSIESRAVAFGLLRSRKIEFHSILQ